MKIGRNDLCGCGSNKKYKKCCLSKDEADNKKKLVKSRTIDKDWVYNYLKSLLTPNTPTE